MADSCLLIVTRPGSAPSSYANMAKNVIGPTPSLCGVARIGQLPFSCLPPAMPRRRSCMLGRRQAFSSDVAHDRPCHLVDGLTKFAFGVLDISCSDCRVGLQFFADRGLAPRGVGQQRRQDERVAKRRIGDGRECCSQHVKSNPQAGLRVPLARRPQDVRRWLFSSQS